MLKYQEHLPDGVGLMPNWYYDFPNHMLRCTEKSMSIPPKYQAELLNHILSTLHCRIILQTRTLY